jgi:hypothetical protein
MTTSTDAFFAKAAEGEESFPSYDYSDDPRATKRGYDEVFAQVKNNRIAGWLCRDPKVVEVEQDDKSKQEKLILTFKVRPDRTKGFVRVKGATRSTPYDPANPAHEILTFWVPPSGNMNAVIRQATGSRLARGQYMEVELIDVKDTGKANLARQFSCLAEAAPMTMSGGDEDGADDDDVV